MKSGLFWIACLLLASPSIAEESFFSTVSDHRASKR